MKKGQDLLIAFIKTALLVGGVAYVFYDSVFGLIPGGIAGMYIYRTELKNVREKRRRRVMEYFKDLIETICNLYPSENLDASPIFLSSHDIPRIPNILAGDFMKEDVNYENVWDMERDDFWYVNGEFSSTKFRKWELEHEKIPEDIQEKIQKQHFLAVFMQYTLPGLPSVFAGDEIGTIGFKDPFNRKTFKWDKVENDIYKYYCSIGKFRNENKENFTDSRNFKFIKVDEEKCIYQRGNLICIANISDHDIYLEDYNLNKVKFSSSKIKDKNTIPAYSSVVL